MKIKYLAFLVCLITVVFFTPTNVSAESVKYIHTDHLGSTSIVTNEKGELSSNNTYYPFGNTKQTQGIKQVERLYTGQISDQDITGLYYYNSRYYNPAIGKFTQADVVNDGQNRYAYVGNNPLVYTDPSGNERLFDGERRILNGMSRYGYHRQTDRLTWEPGVENDVSAIRASLSQIVAQQHVDRYYEYGCGLARSNSPSFSDIMAATQSQGFTATEGLSREVVSDPEFQAIFVAELLIGLSGFAGVELLSSAPAVCSGSPDSCSRWIGDIESTLLPPRPGFEIPYLGRLTNDSLAVLRNFIDNGRNLINTGRYEEAINHFYNEAFAKIVNARILPSAGGYDYPTDKYPIFYLKGFRLQDLARAGISPEIMANRYLESWTVLSQWLEIRISNWPLAPIGSTNLKLWEILYQSNHP